MDRTLPESPIQEETPLDSRFRAVIVLPLVGLAIPTAYAASCAAVGILTLVLESFGIRLLNFATGGADWALLSAILALILGSFLGSLLYLVLGIAVPVMRTPLIALSELVFLVVLPLWGLGINLSLPDCSTGCMETYEALAWPEFLWVYGAYGLGLVAYVVARVRKDPLPAALELFLFTGLGLGLVTALALSVHFGPQMLFGLMFGPIGLPLIAPLAAEVAFVAVILTRILRHGSLALGVGAGFLATLLTGAQVVMSTLWRGSLDLYGGAFTQTCGWTLSQLSPPPADCHYLCTVAAQGHPWLVRPLRLGTRRGRPIVVNRQLAVANAFEDLLHERWPWFGRIARQTYDRVGWPISRHIRSPWVADLIFVGMLPAQALFMVSLLLLDPGDPEQRIDRMYR